MILSPKGKFSNWMKSIDKLINFEIDRNDETCPFFVSFFFYKDFVATTRVPDLLFAGGSSNRPKKLKNPKRKKKK